MKKRAKQLLHVASCAVVFPIYLLHLLSRSINQSESFFRGASQLLSLIPFKLGTYLRAAFYSLCCTSVEQEVSIGFLCLFSHVDTSIGKNVYIGPQSNIGSCSIGDDCLLGSGVHVLSGKRQHSFADKHRPIREQGGEFEKISIGRNCWIGNNATVMANVADHCIIAAGAVVTEPVAESCVVAGNPARTIKQR